MADQHDSLKNIPDSKPVRVFLPLKDSKERYRIHGVYQKTVSPEFNLLFKAGILPVEVIDTKDTCIISVDMGGPNISLEAGIKDITNAQILHMTVTKLFSHDQMREFFRVDTTTSVISKSFQPALYSKEGKEWSIQGRTIDISGSGILASFSEPPPKDKLIRLEIQLPTVVPETITVLAHHVRTVKVSDDQYDVAYHFDDILTEDRDKIIGCCLKIQRRLLKLKVRVKDF